MSNHKIATFKFFICFLLFWTFIGYSPQSTFSENENIDLENSLEAYIKEQEHHIAGLATIVIDQNEIIHKMKGYSNIEEQIMVDENTVF
ncbi:hypothetical protein [Oceanobacillus alkalisoli]|uniref:hypothetical protein n=1 Tax=Oceanobacillus alkalisoli TaxID=2925113 RepID=UPI001EE3CA37|nr:hypothetical protein [Oceanobacillus alkalisoli]MCG5103029.1 hypothetical protein [Oceanobacillus alkalisoli]